MSFESNNDGAEIGFNEHERKIKELQEEESNLLEHAENGTLDQNDERRLNEIHKEIEKRKYEQSRLK